MEENRRLAIRYFRGTISKEDEQRLLMFVGQSREKKELFRQWEREWASTHETDMQARAAYDRFVARAFYHGRQVGDHVIAWRRIAVAAAIAALMAVSGVTAWQVAAHRPETYYTCMAPYGSKARTTLPDGSVVWLNAGSTLRYSNRFDDANRTVELQGEGYFEVSKRDGKEFRVKTHACDVVVKGTKFDVAAYADDRLSTVTLLQGSVEVSKGEERLTMSPGEKVTIDGRSGKMTKARMVNDSKAWMDNNMDFESITLRDLAKVLSRQYDVNIRISSAKLADTQFSVSLRNKETIGDVLNALCKVRDMRVVRQGDNIYLSERPASR